jgi:hypothetical protein
VTQLTRRNDIAEVTSRLKKEGERHQLALLRSSGTAACGPGGLTAWEPGGGQERGLEGADCVDVDYAPAGVMSQAARPVHPV